MISGFLIIMIVVISVFSGVVYFSSTAKDGLVRSNLETAASEVEAVLAEDPNHDFSVPYVANEEVLSVTTGSASREIRLTEDHSITYDRGVNVVITRNDSGYQLMMWHGGAREYDNQDNALVYEIATGDYSTDA